MWILAVTVVVGFILYMADRMRRKNIGRLNPNEETIVTRKGSDNSENSENSDNSDSSDISDSSDSSDSSECCGMHIVCEKDTLSPFSDEIIYYDDEELDRFIGREPSSYTPEEEEEFRDVLMTLLPKDVPGWARSITLRRIELPYELRDELLILVNEQRSINKTK